MYARVATFEGANDVEAVASQIRDGERPEGFPAKELFLLADKEQGKVIAVALFETEEDMRTGNETMNAMSPPGGGLGQRAGVDLMEVVAHMSE
jgi:hypothetical protein